MTKTHVWTLLLIATLIAVHKCPTEWGQGIGEEFGAEDEEINFEPCFEFVCDPIRVRRYTNVLKEVRTYYRKYNRPGMPMSLEAKMMVLSNYMRVEFKEWDFVGFYYLNKERSLDELEIGPYATIIKTPMPLFKKGQGIVGKVWEKEETIIVKNIATEKEYTTYDSRARSEMALPCFDLKGELFGVLKIYSELPNVFEETDQICLEEIINYLDY